MKKYLWPAVLGGVVIFVWGMISWMVLPWHEMTIKSFADEDAVAEAISANTSERGIYYYPGHPDMEGMSAEEREAAEEAHMAKWQKGPNIFVAYNPYGGSMTGPMIRGFIINVIGVLIVLVLLYKPE